MKNLLLFLATLSLAITGFTQTAPSAQWHFDGSRTITTTNNGTFGGYNWVLDLIATQNKQYIACGFTYVAMPNAAGGGTHKEQVGVILKLDNLGYIVWSKVMMSARLFSSPTASTTYYDGGSSFYKVLEEGNGRYFVCGYYNNNTLGKRMGVVIEIADNGVFAGSNSGTLYQFPGSSNTRIGNVAFDPTSSGQRVIIGGGTDVATSGGTEYHGFLSKVNPLTLIPTATNQQVIVGSTGTGNNGTGVASVLTQTNGSGFDVYISGSEHVGGTTSAPTKNADNTNVSVNLPDNDILFMRYDGTNLTSTPFKKTYNKTDLTSYPIPSGEEVGPGSSRSASGSPLKIGGSEAAGLLAPSNNLNESGGSMIFTNTVPQKIAIVAIVNAVGMRPGINGTQIFRNNSTLIDASRSGITYDDYFDADAYLLRIDPSNGNLQTGTAYAGHFSGDDFNIKVVQNNQGDYVLGGSSSDYYSSSLDVITPHSTDGYIVCLDGSNGTRKWRRTYHAQDIEDEFCVFGIAATADGGVALGGNNDNDADNFSVSKFAPPCAKLVSYSLSGVKTYSLGQNGVSTNVTWTSNNLSGNSISGHANIKSHIIVPSGSTLTIDNCDLRFASSDHIYDYYAMKSPLPTGISVSGTKIGIEVRPGGKLILKNGTILQGINDCNDHYMWDGVSIVGNPAISPQSATTQGSLTMSSGSIIKDARIGIEVADAKRNYTPGAQYSVNTGNDLTNGLTNSSRYQENGSLGGGMLNLSYSTIKNCRFGIRWWDYNHPNNTGYIDRCSFINDDYMADICTYISADNRRYGAVSFVNTGSLDKIQILSNNFSCDATKFLPDYRPWGILANETGLNISTDNPSIACPTCPIPPAGTGGNTFTNLGTAVEANYTTMNGRSLSMWYNTFDNNGRGTSVSGSNSLTIAYNKILVSAPNTVYPRPLGALIVASKGYDIGDNVFDKCSTCGTRSNVTQGLVIKNQHILNSLAVRNTFNNLGFATIGLQKNGDVSSTIQGLQFKCNDYLSGGIGDVTRLSIDQSNGSNLSATLRKNQGDPATSGKSAGNRFYNACAGLNHLTSDNPTTQLVKYYYTSASSLYDPLTCITSVYNKVINPNSQSDCPARYSSGSPTFRLAATNELLAGTGLTEDDRQSLLTDQFNLVSDISRDYSNADAYDSAAVLLESYSRYAEALPHYMHLGDWSNARRVWNLLPLDSADDYEYSSLMDMAINLFSADQSWTDLDSSGIATVVTMSSSNTLPGYLAQAIAAQNGWIPSFIWPDAGIEGDSSYDTTGGGGGGGLERRAPAVSSTVSINGIHLYPNPTTGTFTIQSGSAGTGVLYNLQGLKVVQYDVKEGRNDIALPSGLASGIYMLRFTDNATGSTYNTRLVFHP